MDKEVEKQLEKQAEGHYHRAKAMGMSKGEAMKIHNKFHQTVDQAKEIFRENFERDHGVKPCDE